MPTRNNNRATLTVEAILAGTEFGSVQSVGQMEVIPILDGGSASDNDFAPPVATVATATYGTVRARNNDPTRPTIMPMGAGFVTPEAAQDHAVLSAKFLPAGATRDIDGACCIQQTQPGLLRTEDVNQKMVILPAQLRVKALGARKDREYNRMWPHIQNFNRELGLATVGNLVEFLSKYEKELDEFVAEFETLPGQIGAVVLIDGKVVGVERAPNVEFWQALFAPLIRGCYGALAIKARKALGNKVPATRTALKLREKSLAGLAAALTAARVESTRLVQASYDTIKTTPLLLAGAAEEKLGNAELHTIANTTMAGQIVTKGELMPYVSIGPAA